MIDSYYVDTCVYLNLWKKEVDGSNEFWKFADSFFEKVEDFNWIVYYSGFILKELMYGLNTEKYIEKTELFHSSPNFEKVYLSEEEFRMAQKIQKEIDEDVSFYDIIHLLLASKTDSVLVTRDNLLIEIAKRYSVDAKKPEEVLFKDY